MLIYNENKKGYIMTLIDKIHWMIIIITAIVFIDHVFILIINN